MFAMDQKIGQEYMRDIQFFDRDPECFESIIRYYRTGIFCPPTNVPMDILKMEIDFWQFEITEEESKVLQDNYDKKRLNQQEILPFNAEKMSNLFLQKVQLVFQTLIECYAEE